MIVLGYDTALAEIPIISSPDPKILIFCFLSRCGSFSLRKDRDCRYPLLEKRYKPISDALSFLTQSIDAS